MYTLCNAAKNIYRYRGRYVIFGAVYFVLLMVTSVCIAVYVRSNRLNDNIMRQYATAVRFHMGLRPEGAALRDPGRFTKEQWLAFRDMAPVHDVDFLSYNLITNVMSGRYGIEISISSGGNERFLDEDNFLKQSIVLVGYNPSLMHLSLRDFSSLVGRMPQSDYEAVINRVDAMHAADVAWNSVEIGDEVILNTDIEFARFTVVGIVDDNASNHNRHIDEHKRRIMFTTFAAAEAFEPVTRERGFAPYVGGNPHMLGYTGAPIIGGYDAIIFLESFEMFEEFEEMMWDGRFIQVEPLFPYFDTLRRLINSRRMNSLGYMILMGLVIIPMTILSTLLLLSHRKYDIAVLRSIGMRKSALIKSFMIEKLVFLWGISLLTLLPAQFLANPFILAVTSEMENFVSPEWFAEITHVFQLQLVAQNIVFVLGGATALVVLSVLVTCINILRFEPLKIYNKRYY